MTRPLHIVLDIDGVLADFAGGMLPHLSAALGREVHEEHITEYYFERALGITPEVWAALWERHEHRLYAEALPYPGVEEGLRALSSLGRLSIQTGRPATSEAATRSWLAAHLPLPLDLAFRAGSKYTAADAVDYFIEDNLADVLGATAGQALLMDRPWNQSGAPAGIRRVRSLLDAAAIIETDQRAC